MAILVVAAVYGAIQILGPSKVDPATVALPEIVDGVAARAYLDGPGAALLAFADATAPLIDGELDAAGCRSLAETVLAPIGDPQTLLSLAQAIPDPTTSEMAVENLVATATHLGACVAGSPQGDRLTFARVILLRRLREIGAR